MKRVTLHGIGVLLFLAPRVAQGAPTHGVPVQEVELEEQPDDDKVVLEEDEPREQKQAAAHHAQGKDQAPAARPVAHGNSSKSIWLGFGFLQDATLLSGDGVCSPSSQIDGRFTCMRQSGSQYHGTPQTGFAGTASGAALAATRVAISAALPVTGAFGVEARVAYALAGQGPKPDGGKSFLPVHLELQAQYWLTGDAFSTQAVGAFLVASGGISQVDGKTSVTVREDTAVPPPINQLDNPAVQRLDAYHKAGSGFAGAGLGLFVPTGDGFGLCADLRASALFPSSGFAIGLGLSAALGL